MLPYLIEYFLKSFNKLSTFIVRLSNFIRRYFKARIKKSGRMSGHPTTEGKRPKGISVKTPLPWGILKVERLKRRIRNMPSELRAEALSLGSFYEGRNGLEQINSLDLHGLRYWFMSQLVRNCANAEGVPTGAGLRTLEIGCNTGWTSVLSKIECRNLEVTALDISKPLLQLGQILEKALGVVGVRWVLGNGRQLNRKFEDESFDIILLCEILEHFGSRQEQEELLTQAVNVCSQGGKIIVSVPFEDRIRVPGEHLTEFDAALLSDLVQPFASDIVWLAEERARYILDRHFFLINSINHQLS